MPKYRNNKPSILGLANGQSIGPGEIFEAEESLVPQAWRDQKWVVSENDTETQPSAAGSDGPQPVITESAPVRAKAHPTDPTLEETNQQHKRR